MKRTVNKMMAMMMVLSLMCITMTGCGSSKSDSESAGAKSTGSSTETIRVGAFDMPTIYLMQTFQEMGYYKKNNAKVEFVYFPVYSDAISAYNTGNVDMMCYASAEGVPPIVKGVDSKIIAVMDHSNGLDGIAAVKGISSVKDLKGKKVAVEVGTVDHMMLQKALEAEGMSESDINLVNMSSGDAVAAMASGSIDAVSTWEPQLSMAAKNGSIIYSTKDSPNLITDVFLIRSDKLKSQYDNAKAIVKTWFECAQMYQKDPAKFSAKAAKKGNLSVKEFNQLMDVTDLVSLKDNKEAFEKGTNMKDYQYLNILMRNVGDFLYSRKLIENKLTDDMINNSIDSSIVDDLLAK